MKKSDIRKEYLLIREKAKSNEKDKIILNGLISDEKFQRSDLVLTYVSMNHEVDTHEIINKCFELGKKVAVPKTNGIRMQFYFINSFDDLKRGYYNILEPITTNRVISFENSISLTPGVAYDSRGYRIGYGGGNYDRFYEDYLGFKIGLCYSDCVVNELPNAEYDIPVDEIITEKGKVKIKK